MEIKKIEQKAEKQFKRIQDEVEKYYDQALKHNDWFFVAGLTCIGLGFAIMGFTLFFYCI